MPEITNEACTWRGTNTVPMRQWHGHIQAWTIPCLHGRAATQLLETLAQLAEVVCDGYESVERNGNSVARFTPSASDALLEIAAVIDRETRDAETVSGQDAREYFGWMGDKRRQCEELGITAETTDDELTEIERQEETSADDEYVVLAGTFQYLESLRDWAREHQHCQCGELVGETCEWEGPRSEMVAVEFVPEDLRATSAAAGSWTGARRILCARGCADRVSHMLWVGVMTAELDPWVRVVSE